MQTGAAPHLKLLDYIDHAMRFRTVLRKRSDGTTHCSSAQHVASSCSWRVRARPTLGSPRPASTTHNTRSDRELNPFLPSACLAPPEGEAARRTAKSEVLLGAVSLSLSLSLSVSLSLSFFTSHNETKPLPHEARTKPHVGSCFASTDCSVPSNLLQVAFAAAPLPLTPHTLLACQHTQTRATTYTKKQVTTPPDVSRSEVVVCLGNIH